MTLARDSRRALIGALAGALALAVTACAPLTVRSFAARDRLIQYRTYAWGADGERATGDARLDNNPFFAQRLMGDAERELERHGFERADSNPDLTLHYHVNVGQRLDSAALDRMLGFCTGCETGGVYDSGTIVLDLVDTKTNTLVWRAWAEGSLDGLINNQQWLEERIDKSVAKMGATLPRRSRAAGR